MKINLYDDQGEYIYVWNNFDNMHTTTVLPQNYNIEFTFINYHTMGSLGTAPELVSDRCNIYELYQKALRIVKRKLENAKNAMKEVNGYGYQVIDVYTEKKF